MELRKNTTLMRLAVFAILLFNFLVSHAERSQSIDNPHACAELASQPIVNYQMDSHDNCPLESDEDEVVFDSYIEFKEVNSDIFICQLCFPLKHFLSGLYRPPNIA